MKRYDFTSDDVCHSGCRIEEFDDGEYVKWEDVESIERIGFGRVQCGACGADLSKGNHNPSCYIIQPKHEGADPPTGILTYKDKGESIL